MCYTLVELPKITFECIVSFYDMMQGDNGNIKELIGIASLIDLIVIYLIYGCIVVFCLYTEMVLYNIPIGFKIFALMTCISRMFSFIICIII